MSETRLTPARRAELVRLCEAATPGPWQTEERHTRNVYSDDATGSMVAACKCDYTSRPVVEEEAHAAFIAAARTALPEALAEVDRLTALSSDERRRAERLHDDLLVEKGFVTVLRDDIARLKAKVARLEQEP